MICPNCKKENKNTNIRCEYCSTELIDIKKHDELGFDLKDYKEVVVPTKKFNMVANILIFLFSLCFVFFVLFGIFGVYLTVIEYNQRKGYEKTTATLIEDENCIEKEDIDICEPQYRYKYKVDGKNYFVSLDSEEVGEENITIYYNPQKPDEHVVHHDWSLFVFAGIIPIVIIIITFVFKRKFIKFISGGKDYITMYTYIEK